MLTQRIHTLVDLPQMKSEVVKQRLQNPAAAAGGDDQIITKSSIGRIIYTSLRRVCGGGRYLRVRVCFRAPSHTHALLAGCTSTTHVGCELQPSGFGFLAAFSRLFGELNFGKWNI
jgi:hypothetical protein